MILYLSMGLFCSLLTFCRSFSADGMIGPGRWLVINIQQCPEPEKYTFQLDIHRRKVNRTHDGFTGWIEMNTVFDDSYGIRVDICKHVDGGCKPYQVLTDASCCHFIDQYAKENVEKCFTAADIPLPICPMAAGKYSIENFVFDYQELPSNSIYGLFGAKIYALKDGQEVSCVDMTVKFEEDKDDD